MSTRHRRDLNLPDGWHPTVHSTVQVIDHERLRPGGVPVAGLWRCIDRAPDSGWWLQPADVAADRWLTRHGQRCGATSGMVNVHALRLTPWWLQLALGGP